MPQIIKPAAELDAFDEFTLRWMGGNPDHVAACEALKKFVAEQVAAATTPEPAPAPEPEPEP